MKLSEAYIKRNEKKALIAKVIADCKSIADQHIKSWKPLNHNWPTIQGAAYLRLSTEDQVMVERGSLEQQINIAIVEANLKSQEKQKNYQIVNFFIESGITGKTDKRPQFQIMRNEISRKKFSFVIVKEISRIARNAFLWKEFFNSCIKNECEIVIRGLHINPNDPEQLYILDQLALDAERESNRTSKRIKENNHTALTISKKFNSTPQILGLDQKIENGRKLVGQYVKNEKESLVVNVIFETLLSTESESVTLKKLHELGIANKGKTFTRSSLHNFLTNTKLIAQAERNRKNKDKDERFLMPYDRYELVHLPYEPVISYELWSKVQIIIKRNADKLQKNTNLNKIYLLSGLLKLSDGSTFHGTAAHGNGGHKYYYFNKCHSFRLDTKEIENAAADAVLKIISSSKKLINSIVSHSKSQSRQVFLQNEIQRLNHLIDGLKIDKQKATTRLDTLIQNGSVEKRREYVKEFENETERVNTEMSKLQAQIDTHERTKSCKADDFLTKFKDDGLVTAKRIQELIKEKADPVLIKGAYRKLFKTVLVEPCQQTGTYKLRFVIGSGPEAPTISNGGKGSVMAEVVGAQGLEPRILRL